MFPTQIDKFWDTSLVCLGVAVFGLFGVAVWSVRCGRCLAVWRCCLTVPSGPGGDEALVWSVRRHDTVGCPIECSLERPAPARRTLPATVRNRSVRESPVSLILTRVSASGSVRSVGAPSNQLLVPVLHYASCQHLLSCLSWLVLVPALRELTIAAQ